MTTLLRNPASFEGQTIRVTGQYRSLPLLVCGNTIHRSPATWTLVFGDIETFASGFDEALRPLAASGLSLTIEGRWQKWEGPVGCGRRAPTQEIWYLAASRIVSPNPLVKSDSDEGEVVLLPTSTPIIDIAGTPVAEITPDVPPTFPPEEPGGNISTPTPSPTFQLIPTAQTGATATNISTSTSAPTATTASGNGSSTSTPTPTSSATATTTADGTAVTDTPTPTASATTTGGTTPSATTTPADQGTIAFDSVEKQVLAANSTHTWHFNPPADEPITITAGSSLGLNLKLELIGPNGSVLATADLAGTGEPEIITHTTSNPTGEFQIVVSGVGSTSGAYVLMLFDSDSKPVVVIQDTLVYGSGGAGNIPAGVDHFWNFEGQAGDTISIEVSPTGSIGDLIFYLIGPDGSELEFINDTGVGASESLTDYTLPDSGFYSIGIGELDFGPVEYSLTLLQ